MTCAVPLTKMNDASRCRASRFAVVRGALGADPAGREQPGERRRGEGLGLRRAAERGGGRAHVAPIFCWTKTAVAQLARVKSNCYNVSEGLALASQMTDANAAIFDAANQFRGSIPGIHEILRQQGLLLGRWCLDPHEELSPGQLEEIERVCRSYPTLQDDAFVREHLDEWLR